MAIKFPFNPAPPPEAGDIEAPFFQRLLWFGGLMLASVIVVSASAYILRGFLFIA